MTFVNTFKYTDDKHVFSFFSTVANSIFISNKLIVALIQLNIDNDILQQIDMESLLSCWIVLLKQQNDITCQKVKH